jgi:GNAT superfamily N-acetyltransferase
MKTQLPEGFTVRPGTMEDLTPAVKLFNRCSLKMIGLEEFDDPEVKNEWLSPGFNQQTDQWVVLSPEGELVGYIEVWTTHDVPVHPWVWGRVDPDYEGLGIGTYLLEWAEERCKQVLDIVPKTARVSFYSGSLENYKPSNDLLSGYGMELIRHNFRMVIHMKNAPPKPVWPEGITLRTYDYPNEAFSRAIFEADDEAFQDHFGYVEGDLDKEYKRYMHFFTNSETFDPDLWFIAMDGEEIAGISLCQKWVQGHKDMGWVASLAVRRPWRNRGIGLALLQHSFRVFWGRGYKKVGLGVDASNLTGALNLYKKAGMEVDRQFNLYEKELRPGEELQTEKLEV